jgi:hypothetical protein
VIQAKWNLFPQIGTAPLFMEFHAERSGERFCPDHFRSGSEIAGCAPVHATNKTQERPNREALQPWRATTRSVPQRVPPWCSDPWPTTVQVYAPVRESRNSILD